MKLKAAAMFYALVVATLMGLISSSIILYAYHNRIQSINLDLHKQAVQNTLSAINLLIAHPDQAPKNDKQTIHLFDDENAPVEVRRLYWGGFELVAATSTYNGFSFTKSALVGAYLMEGEQQSLYLADLNRPLSLCGRTNIVGEVYLPASGVKRAYIEGQSFVGTKLIDGTIKNSEKQLPEINQEMITANTSYLNGNYNANDSVVGEEAFENDTIIHSFKQPTLIITGTSLAIVRGIYQGNIKIVASQSIYVGEEAQLNDVILYAPQIIVERGFEGSLQLFASDSLVIEKKVKLLYPSVVATISGSNAAKLIIQEEAQIQGVVFAVQEQQAANKDTYLSIERDVAITGQVYSNGTIDLKGAVYGSVLCKKFMLKTPSSVYENHLLNATIDVTKLPKQFVGIDLIRDNNTRKLVKWIE